jgi:hypothetical protein
MIQLANEIDNLISGKKDPDEYMRFVSHIFKDFLLIDKENPIWNFLSHIEQETDFYTAPASTRFHGAEPTGLVRHSLLVLAKGIRLAPAMLNPDPDFYYLSIACVFHDLCKINMYETKSRNVKNPKTGNWDTEPFYSIKKDYLAFGHGIESMLRINKWIQLPECWNHAVRWHMGAFDISQSDKFSLEKALALYKEVLFLQTADMQAGLVDEV